ncbi:uncharacterized protein LOC116503370 isoform X2 [Thamnophis elegans]|uniref:uncharacterized protein LOC116503370 isoform X2 n=1 Tax=Thamnophis elegans TaxID=35005 RepID=UPI001378799B|nr:uncharacterized protein LOC116503370 isoform X2 [Thamnophis elegans]
MELSWAPLWLLWAVLESSVPGSRCGSPRHSLCYSYLRVSESSQGLPEFLSMVHLDDQPITQYDNNTMKMVPWLEMVDTTILVALERVFGADLEWLSKLNHKAGGLHTWQVSLGCELKEDGSKGGFLHYGYNGMDFISFEKETLRWVTAQPQAQKVKEKWEDDTRKSQRNIIYLEETCINMMQKYLPYQKEALLQTEPPVGKVTHKVMDDSLEILICQAFGFYPKEIQATWIRDGEVCHNETLHRNVAPNSDGTYYVQLSIEIDPKERDHFRCYLEHEGLQEPLVLSWKEETEPPVGKVTRKVVNDSLEVLICQAFGFYSKEIQATWRRDGEVCEYETLHRNVAPNSDGTYNVKLSIEIDPKERDHFQCHLEHEGLQEPLVLSWKEEIEPPVGKVTRKVVNDSLEVLICQAFGFYPKEIQATWMRDGEVCQYETLHRNVAPNSDGTYNVQLSIEIDPKERNHFRCHLEHEGLQEPLDLAWKEEKDTWSFHSVGVVMIIILGAVILFLTWWLWAEDRAKGRREKISEGFPRCLFRQGGRSSSGDFRGGPSEEQPVEHLDEEEMGEMQLQLEGSQTQPEAQDGEGLKLQLIRKDEKNLLSRTEQKEAQWRSVHCLFPPKE